MHWPTSLDWFLSSRLMRAFLKEVDSVPEAAIMVSFGLQLHVCIHNLVLKHIKIKCKRKHIRIPLNNFLQT